MRGSYGCGRAASPGLVAGLIACALVLACDDAKVRPPEPRVDEDLARVIPELVDAVQAKQPLFVMDHVDESFREAGGLDYFDVRTLVDGFAFRDEDVGARLESVSIAPGDAGEQRVSARVAFALGTRLAPGGPLPANAVVYSIDLVFAKKDGLWRARGGSYRRE